MPRPSIRSLWTISSGLLRFSYRGRRQATHGIRVRTMREERIRYSLEVINHCDTEKRQQHCYSSDNFTSKQRKRN